jgi:dolichyl-phosphate-mannose--protein O-mannosyl transferase
LIRLVRIKVTSCFRLIGALIADRLAFEVFALALALQHYLLATSRGVRMRVELIVIWIIAAQVYVWWLAIRMIVLGLSRSPSS